MIRKIRKKRKGSYSKGCDRENERLFQQLRSLLTEEGFTVRRERLKSGHGWRAISGMCRAVDKNVIFVDSRLKGSEQVAFLMEKIQELEIALPKDSGKAVS
ncbi:MAG: hypothetical protein D6808_06330 [Candidatus Dadabacteria bacterium]|nr:MAG: hypothetical protein D6808_06330 [Candidatus Dadabacteria bacterium]